MKPLLALIIVAALLVTSAVAFARQSFFSSSSPFVTREGYKLYLGGEEFRFGGANLYWLGLDQNDPPGYVGYPTKFRIRDGLDTVKGMGLRVVRGHTLGISVGNSLSFEPSLDVFNQSALDAADYAIWYAEQIGIKLVIPLIDNWRYYEGGKHNFCQWAGYKIGKESVLDICNKVFYSNETIIASFERFIKERLTHVNKYTGRATYDEPSIMMWETGNELVTATPQWTRRIARFIKSIDKNHLVLSGQDGVVIEELKIEEVDVYSRHFYPPVPLVATADADLCKAANKVYFVGEYGWTYNGTLNHIKPLLKEVYDAPAAAGACFWSLFPHADRLHHEVINNGSKHPSTKFLPGWGFVQHGDGFTLHYPGDWPFMKKRLQEIEDSAWQIRSNGTITNPCKAPVASRFRPMTAPVLARKGIDAEWKDVLVWRGVAGATSYQVWVEVMKQWANVANVTDNQLPWDGSKYKNTFPAFKVIPMAEVCGEVYVGPESNKV